MDILILSKTHMNGGRCCVGGITGTGRYVRLLTSNEENQPENTELSPRQVWNIEFIERRHPNPPHVEDVLIQSRELKGILKDEIKVVDFIKERKIPIWKGSPDTLFESLIKWTNSGSGFINRDAIPNHSVGFWISNRDLTKREFNGIRYNYPNGSDWRSLKFVGFETPVDKIPAGTLLRVSLARWWQQDENTEERCFLQLSGWYDFNESNKTITI
jgi:hypothetical protein